ncbi:hypothetical protein SCHPADRAFT_868244 [Schizopora paradoxa]|uniref:Mid2 domain-containing protein n=1 Tax=Schizopora paradoxa TaxID=27342 RepID=A0A0H2S731_9AGAM|nr:hypothetical protein SCHPADRAFT_868244 [Schizopora paradoxa]
MGRPLRRPRLLLLLVCIVVAISGRVEGVDARDAVLLRRQTLVDPFPTVASSDTATSTSTTTSSTSTTSTSTTSTSSTTSTTSTSSTSSTTSSTSTTSTSTTAAQPTSNTADSTTVVTGNTSTATVTLPPGGTSSSTSTSATSTPTSDQDNSDDSSGVGTGTIVGLSVAGGIAVLGVVGFLVWKFTRKRGVDFDDEPIKWPELNSHSDNVNYALPANRAAGSTVGGESNVDSVSEVDLPRQPGVGYNPGQGQYGQTAGASDSTAELFAPGSDPYAIPPLPHNNPNAPYRDDPYASQGPGYYDPYRGPVPQAFNDAASMDSHPGMHNAQGYYTGGESIPMSNLAPGGGAGVPGGRRSPNPQMAYDMGRGGSPALGMGGRQSPGPGVAYGGRMSPGPGVALGAGRRSPGPDAAYGGGM